MKLFVGLGNPGKQYVDSRHNCGFCILDKTAEYIADFKKNSTKDYISYEFNFKGEKVFLLYPQLFMNLSGEATKKFMDYFKINIDDLYVIQDDMDLNLGKIKLKRDGRSAGHKGIENIIQNLKTDKFKRIKIGIGKPSGDNVIDFVLSKPTDENEMNLLKEGLEQGFSAVIDILNNDFDHAMNIFNSDKNFNEK